MTRITPMALLLALTVGVGVALGPAWVRDIRADEPPALGVQERLASLERRVATLEGEVDRLGRSGQPTPTAAGRAPGETGPAEPARDNAEAAPPPRVKITPVDRVRRGQPVVLRGEVERVRDEDEFVLRDATGSIEVYIGWQNPMPVRVGDRVTVHGVADDDAFPGRRPDVYAREIVLPDGTTRRMRLDE
ncbi:MAG: NirD/YgiW/YdeI family stress tolerance protein [Planctomycetota bacterium]